MKKKATTQKEKNEVIFKMVTDRVILSLEDAIKATENGEKAVCPWNKPWHGGVQPCNLVTKKPYQGINAFLTAMMGFESPYFVTYKQAKSLGGQVIKGEKATPIVFWKSFLITKDKTTGEKLEKPFRFWMLRYYSVFNLTQTEGIDEKKIPELIEREFNPIEDADNIIANMPNAPEITHKQAQACYYPSLDKVNMPRKELFKTDAEYYSTTFHELVHSTGHSTRLDRKEGMESISFGSHNYSVEELVAEMGSIFLCNTIGIEATYGNSIAYLKGWLSKLKNDTQFLMTASKRAQDATNYILDCTPDYSDKKQDKKEPKKVEVKEEEKELVEA